MANVVQTLPKGERLSWKRYIDLLFKEGKAFKSFPYQIVYTITEEENLPPVSILISVSKKRFKNAVDRNRIKRQTRESYRRRKQILFNELIDKGNQRLLVAFIFIDKEIHSSSDINFAMDRALEQLKNKL